ncbi:MAG: InlB B-repeat-containing protein, partial [Treponema sp.]|nr:InlB B-repeat-containing protein [Treponema sp.]
MVNRLTSRRTLILLAAFLTACTNPFFAARLDRPAGPDKEPEPVPVVYTVTFDSHDGSAVEAITGDEGTQVSKPEDPIKTGFIFSGWFDAESGGTAYTWPHTLTGNLTMHARWTAFYTVTFDKNGGDTEAEPRTKTLSPPATTVDALPAPPERTGYIFTGWNTQADLMGDSFIAATAVTEDITVYAYWIADQPSSALTLYKGTSVVDPGKKVEEISGMASLVAWLLRPGSLASSTEYLAVLGSDLELTTGFVLGGLPLLYNNIAITIQGDAPARTIKMKGTSYLEIGSGVTIRLGSNIRLRGYNQNDDGENNDMPLVYIDGGALEMLAGSEISGNVNQQSGEDAYGGGVYLRSGSFAMKGGVVKDNAINVDSGNIGYGAGVFVSGGTFSIEGEAQVDTGNEVCLWGSPVITLTGNLSAAAVAVIRPNSYADGAAVLGGEAAIVAANYNKFQVQPDGSDVWTIGSDGKLVAPRYVVAWELNGGAWPGGVSPESQVETGGKITRPADPVKANYAL